jgi:hypothetical protein
VPESDLLSLSAGEFTPHQGQAEPSTVDVAAQRVGSLAQASWGNLDVRIPTFSLDDLPQAVYDKMEKHPMVGLAVELKTNVIANQGIKFVHADPRVAAVCAAVWAPHHATYIRNSIRTGVHRGFCPFETVWSAELGRISITYQPESTAVADTPDEYTEPVTEDFDGRLLGKLKPLQPANVYGILIDGVENFCGYKLVAPANGELKVEEGSCLHFTHNARWGNYFGEGEGRRAYEAWYWQNIVVLYWVRYLGRLASPVPVIKYPSGYVTPDNKSASIIAQEMGTALVKGDLPIITLPLSGDATSLQWDVDFQELKSDVDFLKAIEYFNGQILRALLMPDSVATTQGLSANRSIGEVHQDSFYAACDGYIEELAQPLNKQIAPLIALYNFGPDVIPPTVEIPPIDSARTETIRQMAVNAARAGSLPVDWSALDNIGIPVDKKALAAHAGGGQTGSAATLNPTDPGKGTASIEAEEAEVLHEQMLSMAEGLGITGLRDVAHDLKMRLAALGA